MKRTIRATTLTSVAAILAATISLCGCGGTSGSATGSSAAAASQSASTAPPASTTTTTSSTNAGSDPVALSASTYSVAQGDGSATITVTRTGSAVDAVSVDYSTSDGTAVAGTDYTATNGTLSWGQNDSTTKTISVPVSSATPFSGDKTFTLVLNNPSAQANIGSPGSATVTISGAASPTVGTLVLSDDSYTVAQSAGSVTISVNRSGGAVGTTSVSYNTSSTGGSAVAGTDYTAASGTLTWADGDSAAKSFKVVVSNAKPFSGNKTFSVGISGPTGGATLGDTQSSTVTIAGSASAAVGNFQLSTSAYTVGQASGTVTVTVNRASGSNGAASVNYSTTNGTAISGTDYTSASGTLKWTSGDTTSKSFSVAVSNSNPFAGSKSFTVNLSTPSAGATISSPGSATVTINGDGAKSASTSTFWVYQNGVFNWGGDYSSNASPNYKSTAGSPESGPYDIAVNVTGAWGEWLPYAGGTVPTWNFNATGYNYLTVDLKPTVANQVWQIYFIQVGDKQIVNASGQGEVVNPANYGPAPVVGKWATYKIPLSAVLTQYAGGSPVFETSVYKFGIQDQTGLGSNVWYVDNVGFTQ